MILERSLRAHKIKDLCQDTTKDIEVKQPPKILQN